MPLYLCQPGTASPAPWRHGISVYAKPFAVNTTPDNDNPPLPQRPLRRLRHAELVLVDDVCQAFGKTWLRLRWPGRRGDFAGYLPVTNDDNDDGDDDDASMRRSSGDEQEDDGTCVSGRTPRRTTRPCVRLAKASLFSHLVLFLFSPPF
jgi:hypothetical protein